MSTPLVSIIVPNYNHCSYLSLRIESILRQSYANIELILLDDCSSDNSRELLLSYSKDIRVTHILFNENNSGSTFKQWDKGFQLARGEYVWIAESDDFADRDFLKETVAALEENRDAVIVFTGSQLVNAQGGNVTLDSDKFPPNAPLLTLYDSLEFLTKRMLWTNSIYNASMVLFRRASIENVQLDYKRFRYCGDWLFWIEICRQGKVISLNRKLNYFRQHENKVSPGAEKEGLYFIEGGEIMEHMFSYLQLSSYQQWVVEGRTLKRLSKIVKKKPDLKKKVLEAYPLLFKRGKLSVFVYTFDKLFNFSKLQS